MYLIFYPTVMQNVITFVSQCIVSKQESDSNYDSSDSNDNITTDIIEQELVSEILITVFEVLSDCRSSLLSLIMKGMVACNQSTKMFKAPFTIAEKTFIKLFRDVCYRHPHILVDAHSSLENYILTATSSLPVHILEQILLPLSTVCSLSLSSLSSSSLTSSPPNAIYGHLITCYRKCLLHPDIERKSFAIKSLVHLLPKVSLVVLLILLLLLLIISLLLLGSF